MPDGRVIKNVPDGTTKQQLLQKLGDPPPLGTARIGMTGEGRPMIQNPDGSVSTERTITVTHPRINGGKPTNIPSMFGGKEVSEEEAARRIIRADGKDPETGRLLLGFDTIEDAVNAARARSESIPQQPPEDVGFGEAAGRGALVQFLGNLGALPEGVLQSLLPRGEGFGPIEAVSALTKLVTGGAVDPVAAAPAAREQIEGSLSGENIIGAARTIPGVRNILGETGQPTPIGEAQAQEQATTQRFTEQAPVATAIGEAGGDIATLLTGRAAVRGLSPKLAAAAPKVAAQAPTIIGRALQGFARTAAKTGTRAVETGAEGAFLASLNDANPAEVAAMGAGSQVLGDVALSTFRGLAKKNRLLKAIALGTVVSLGVQQMTPGGLDRVLPTFEGRNKEAILTFLLSGGAAAITGGRIPKGFAGPAFAEIVDVTRRGALLSLITSMTRDPVRTGPIVQKFTEDPEFFGANAKRLLTRAINSDSVDVRNTVDRLMKDKEFRKRFEALDR